MKVCLLYRDRDPERLADGTYADAENIIRDLGLDTLFHAAGRRLISVHGKVAREDKEDPWIVETMRKIMMIPLTSGEEIEYRQAVLKDCFAKEDLLRQLYRISSETVERWDSLGRKARDRSQQRSPVIRLTEEIQAYHLICDSLKEIRELLTEGDPDTGKRTYEELESEGFRGFYERFREAFSREREAILRKVLEDIAFYTETGVNDGRADRAMKPRIVLECGLEDGLKFSSMKLAHISSEPMKFYRPGTMRKIVQEHWNARIPDSFSVEKDMRLAEQVKLLEYGTVSYLTGKVLAGIREEFQTFFDQLKRQTAFFLGTVQLAAHMKLYEMDCCYPEASEKGRTLEFRELRECAMGIKRHMNHVIGNTCVLNRKNLLIVTGANQGGKSTFLRSIGIAQVMMQCGMPAAAQEFRSSILPRIFVHFTRREDSSMNSGRLEEELGRMNRIVEQIGDGSLVLLNESFATTTEKEGSAIAYDVTRALNEAGVKILTVTHLLSFAKRVYAETKDNPESEVAFLSAERKEDGTRTYRMIRHVPELTSFGLDLYEEIVERKRQ